MEKEFLELAHRLRDAQKQYFKTRNKLDLKLSMELEKKFDALLEKVAPTKKRQLTVWNQEPEKWITERDTQAL